MKVSVIVPIYNASKYLSKCLDSILIQTYQDIEVICVNDGSTDNSLEIIESYAKSDNRIRIISQSNGGRSSARNRGIKEINTELFIFVDADDEIMPDAVETLLNGFSNEVVCVVSSLKVNHEVFLSLAREDNDYYSIKREGKIKIEPKDLFSFHASVCGVLYRRSVVLDLNLSFPLGLNYEDVFWHWCYLCKGGVVSFVSKATYIYTRHIGSIMSDTFGKKEGVSPDHIKIVNEIFAFYERKSLFNPSASYVIQLLETYLYIALEHASQVDKLQVYYLCAKTINRFQIDVHGSNTLNTIVSAPPFFSQDIEGYKYFSILKKVIDKLLPKGSRRRRFARNILKKVA